MCVCVCVMCMCLRQSAAGGLEGTDKQNEKTFWREKERSGTTVYNNYVHIVLTTV